MNFKTIVSPANYIVRVPDYRLILIYLSHYKYAIPLLITTFPSAHNYNENVIKSVEVVDGAMAHRFVEEDPLLEDMVEDLFYGSTPSTTAPTCPIRSSSTPSGARRCLIMMTMLIGKATS